MEPHKYYPITINSRFEFGDMIFPVKCRAIKDSDSYCPYWYVGDSFIFRSICTNCHCDKIYLGDHEWGKENKHFALDVDAYHTLADAEHQVELRNRHYIRG